MLDPKLLSTFRFGIILGARRRKGILSHRWLGIVVRLGILGNLRFLVKRRHVRRTWRRRGEKRRSRRKSMRSVCHGMWPTTSTASSGKVGDQEIGGFFRTGTSRGDGLYGLAVGTKGNEANN